MSSGNPREVTLSWTPTEREYLRALRLWRDASGQRGRARNRGATLAAAGFVLLVFVLASGGASAALAALAPLVLLLVGIFWWRDVVPYWGLKRAVRTTPAMLAPVTITVGKDGLVTRTGPVTQRFDWPRFAAYVEIPDLIVLGLTPDSPAVNGILPRSSASSSHVWDSVGARVRRNVALHPRLARLEAAKAESA